MNIFPILYVVGIYFFSSAASFHVKHEVKHKQKINQVMQESETMDNTGEKLISEQARIIKGSQNIQSKDHSENKLNSFPRKTLMNLNNEENKSLIDHNGTLRHNDYINKYEKEDNSEKIKDSVEDTADIWITGDSEQNSRLNTSENEDQQSGDGLTSGEVLELHGNLQMESNMLHSELDEDTNKEYINIPEELIDEDLRYVLHGTYDTNIKPGLFQNETYEVQILKKANLEDVSILSELESNMRKLNKDDGDSYNSSKSDTGLMEKGVQGEETTDHQSKESMFSGGDVPDYHNKIIENGQKENITGQTPSTHSSTPETVDILLNNRKIRGHNSASKKQVKNVEINKAEISDPCANFRCKLGKTCKTDGQGNPMCACQDPDLCQPTNLNDQVCGTDNKTYSSICHLFATKCQLEGTKEGNHLHLDYQGPCKYIPLCTDYELVHFPYRMRDWLKNVLMQLYGRSLESPDLLSEKQRSKVKKIYDNEKRLQKGDHKIELLAKDFQKNYQMYVYPVHWQFNQLDQHSIDRLLTRSELSALRAPLIPMEHCVTAFLQGCNTNNDKHISLQEWCHCFGIKDGDIDENLLF